jgi:signal transduction histidine kinase
MNPTPEEMEKLRQELKESNDLLSAALSEIKQVKTALVGDPELKTRGLVDDVRANTEYIEKDRKFKAKAVGVIGGLQIIGFFVIDFFKNLKQ